MSKLIVYMFGAGVVVLMGVTVWLIQKQKAGEPKIPEPIVCTMDAQLCPDGSSVGRDPGDNCEFKPCPEATTTNQKLPTKIDERGTNPVVGEADFTGWKTYRNEKYGFEVKYPSQWTLQEQEIFGKKGFFFSSKNDLSQLHILPEGEFDYDYGINFSEDQFVLDGKNFRRLTHKIQNRIVEILRGQDFVPSNWSSQHRIEALYPKDDRDTKDVLYQLLSTFKFIPSTDSTSSQQASSEQVK